MIKKNNEEKHIAVLLSELINNINISSNNKNIIVDATLWMAGHAKKIIEKLNIWDIFIWFDCDLRNLILAKEIIQDYFKDDINIVKNNNYIENKINIVFINSNFANIKEELEKIEIYIITWIYYDLWISSLHIDEAIRWFSFKNDGPIDMRFDNSRWKNAKNIINTYTKDKLKKIFIEYGEESNSEKIVNWIIETRKKKQISTTKELADIIDNISKNPKTKAKIFQAIRIETNNELENIEKSIKAAISILKKDSNIFIISFHSLEDRIVKNIFKQETKDCICRDIICTCKHKKTLQIINKKPLLPSKEEIKTNSRSRSAKARYAIKI